MNQKKQIYPEIIEAIENSIQQAGKWNTGKPYLFANNRSYTLEEVLSEMKQGTEFGIKLQQGIFNLTVDLLTREKEKL